MSGEELFAIGVAVAVVGAIFVLPLLCFAVSEWRQKRRNPDTLTPKEYAHYIGRKGEDPNEY